MNVMAPPGTSTTVQGIAQGIYDGFGKIYLIVFIKNRPIRKNITFTHNL